MKIIVNPDTNGQKSNMSNTALTYKQRMALDIKEAFDRFATGQATYQDKQLVKKQNTKWTQIAKRYARLPQKEKDKLTEKRAALIQAMALAEKQGNQIKLAMTCIEYFNLNQ